MCFLKIVTVWVNSVSSDKDKVGILQTPRICNSVPRNKSVCTARARRPLSAPNVLLLMNQPQRINTNIRTEQLWWPLGLRALLSTCRLDVRTVVFVHRRLLSPPHSNIAPWSLSNFMLHLSLNVWTSQTMSAHLSVTTGKDPVELSRKTFLEHPLFFGKLRGNA